MSTEPLDDPVLQEAIHRFTTRAFSNTPGVTSQETAALQDGLRQILHNEEIPGTELSQILALIRHSVGITEELVDAAPAQARSLLQALEQLAAQMVHMAPCTHQRLLRRPQEEDHRCPPTGHDQERGRPLLRGESLLGQALRQAGSGGPHARPEEAPRL